MVASYTLNEKGNRVPQKKAGDYRTNCPNCGRELSGVLWIDNPKAKDWDESFDFIRGEKKCRCGSLWLIADNGENMGLYPLKPHLPEKGS